MFANRDTGEHLLSSLKVVNADPVIMKKIHRGIRNHGKGWQIDSKNRYNVIDEHYQWVVWTGHNLLSQKDS